MFAHISISEHLSNNPLTGNVIQYDSTRHRPIMPKILPIMLLSIAQKLLSLLCSRTDCFIGVYQPFLTALLE